MVFSQVVVVFDTKNDRFSVTLYTVGLKIPHVKIDLDPCVKIVF
jgi:hypothetical protein